MTQVFDTWNMFNYSLYEIFDGHTQNELEWEFDHVLEQDETFEIDDVTYEVLETDYFKKKKLGTAIIKMTRYKISDESTQIVHVCPAKKASDQKMDRDDMIIMKKQLGEKRFKKYVKKWKKQQSRVKMQSYNRIEITCPHCKVVFWKSNNSLPSPVFINKLQGKKTLKKPGRV